MGMAELLFSVAKGPFRVVQAISMRQPEGGRGPSVHRSRERRGHPSIPAEDRMVNVPADDPRLAMTLPYNKAFTGKLYIRV